MHVAQKLTLINELSSTMHTVDNLSTPTHVLNTCVDDPIDVLIDVSLEAPGDVPADVPLEAPADIPRVAHANVPLKVPASRYSTVCAGALSLDGAAGGHIVEPAVVRATCLWISAMSSCTSLMMCLVQNRHPGVCLLCSGQSTS